MDDVRNGLLSDNDRRFDVHCREDERLFTWARYLITIRVP